MEQGMGYASAGGRGSKISKEVKLPVTVALREVGDSLDLSFETVYSTVKTYAARNAVAHASEINDMVAAQDWDAVAKILDEDLRQLSTMLPTELKDEKPHLLEVLQRFRDTFFKTFDQLTTTTGKSKLYYEIHKEIYDKDNLSKI